MFAVWKPKVFQRKFSESPFTVVECIEIRNAQMLVALVRRLEVSGYIWRADLRCVAKSVKCLTSVFVLLFCNLSQNCPGNAPLQGVKISRVLPADVQFLEFNK
jgi:hypothetical protein